jgi:hypothetical protein
MIRKFKHVDDSIMEFYLEGDNSYCLVDGEGLDNKYHQWTYELWISKNKDDLTEIKDLFKIGIKKHCMTE